MQILITGGTGFVGHHLARLLINRGHDLRMLVRKTSSHKRLEGLTNIQFVHGDITQPKTLANIASDVDCVVHLIGIIRENPREGITFEEIHADGTQNMIRTAQAAGVRRWIQMSALGTRPNAIARYHRTKWAAEETVRSSNLEYTIFRPSIIYGIRGAFTEQLVGMVRKAPFIPVIGGGGGMLQPIHVDEVCACFISSIESNTPLNNVFELGGPDRLRFHEIVEFVAEVMGEKKRRAPIPMLVAKTLFGIMNAIGFAPGGTPLPSQDQLIMLGEENICDIAPLKKAFGFTPRSFRDNFRPIIEACVRAEWT